MNKQFSRSGCELYMSDGLRVVNLYCGAGGFSFGFLQERFDVILGIDSELAVKDTFLANHPEIEFLHSDMRKVSSELLYGFGPVDVLIGSPPCVDFSLMSTDNRDPEKGLQLVREFFRIEFPTSQRIGGLPLWRMGPLPVMESFQTSEGPRLAQINPVIHFRKKKSFVARVLKRKSSIRM